ncbi:type II secretion system protein N [Caldimonas brevitalea]|uniref:Type II secretion system protein N n=1 Tax=Caldimonas brevitalea TaxID=413882 RepID=A0A0G3BTX3_9BURK|nr:type II secretion system protein N [Caldimonas brevitalea]AKJ31483.1 general secretion pathway protein GspN [Caldimonas brevitalea]
MKLRTPRFKSKANASRFGNSRFANSRFANSRFANSRFASDRPVRSAAASAARRWAWFGAALGVVVGVVAFAPATWLANQVASATGQRVLLAQADGTVWRGSAVLVLTGGADSRDAATLPGRLSWNLGLVGRALQLDLRQDCCLNGTVSLQIRPGLVGRTEVKLLPHSGWIGQWPSGLLSGLGTPWNTLRLGGAVRLSSPGLVLEQAAGRWQMQGRAEFEVLNASSPVTTLDQLGSYRLTLFSNPEGQVQTQLSTTEGALQLSGDGIWGSSGVRFRGEARASEGNEAALNNLLNIIGRRDGERSVISIG